MRYWKALLVGALFACTSSYAQVQLVTEAESRASAAAPMLLARTATVPDAPKIEILAPDLKSPISGPTRVQLRFTAIPPATLIPATFKALYGAFKIDITGRLLQYAKVTEQGLVLEQASLPAGSHRIFLEVQDSAGRTGMQVLSVTVL